MMNVGSVGSRVLSLLHFPAVQIIGSICLGLVLGAVLSFVLQPCVFAHIVAFVRKPKKRPLTYTGDVENTTRALQTFQVMIGRVAAERNPTLKDLADLLRMYQRDFGSSASLETVIQQLSAQYSVQLLEMRRAAKKMQSIPSTQPLGSSLHQESTATPPSPAVEAGCVASV